MLKKIIVISIISLLAIACNETSTQSTDQGTGQISLVSVFENNSSLAKLNPANVSGISAVDSISITRARFLIRNVRFKTEIGDSIEFKSAPTVVDLDIDGGTNPIQVLNVPPASYQRLEFRIHRLDPDDPQDKPYAGLPEFADFIAGDRYSMIIEGMVYANQASTGSPFTFRSRDNESQRHELFPPLQISESDQVVEVRLVIDSGGWFIGSDGSLLDPRVEDNESKISKNLINSIEADFD